MIEQRKMSEILRCRVPDPAPAPVSRFSVYPEGAGNGSRIRLALACLAGVLLVLNPVAADSLVTYTEFEEGAGGDPVTSPTTLHDALSATAIEVVPEGNITLGDTHADSWESPLPYLQSRGGWDAATSESAKAFTFTLNAADNTTFALSGLRFEDRVTGAGPSAVTVSINETVVFARDVEADVTERHTVDLTGFALTGLSSAEFVFAGWDNGSRSTSGGGDWRTGGYAVEGEVSVIPESGVFALFAGLAALIAVCLRRRVARACG